MKKKSFFILMISMFLFFLMAQNSWAIKLTYISGEIYSKTETNFKSGFSNSVSGWDASGGIDKTLSDAGTLGKAHGFASGQKINGQSGDNHVRFILTSTAESSNGKAPTAFSTSATVRSGANPNDMIAFQLVPEPEEEGKAVELTAQAFLSGSLNSSGQTYMDPSFKSGEASLDFIFKIYKDPTQAPIMSFTYSNKVKNEGDQFEEIPTKTEFLPGLIGKEVNSETFMTDDVLYVYFEQIAGTTVGGSKYCGAQAFGVQSTEDIMSIAIDAKITTAPPPPPPHHNPNPEPSTLVLFLIGFGLVAVAPVIKKKVV